MAIDYKKYIPGYEGQYAATKSGQIFSLKGNNFFKLKPSKDKYGRMRVNLGKGNTQYVHRVILLTFVGPCPDGFECLHFDGDTTNNKLSNLKWGTSKENTEDQRRHGTLVNRSNHGMTKIKKDDIPEIKRLYESGLFQYQIAEKFNVTQPTISRILNI